MVKKDGFWSKCILEFGKKNGFWRKCVLEFGKKKMGFEQKVYYNLMKKERVLDKVRIRI